MPVKSLEVVTNPKILLKKYWGHDEFRPLQEKIIDNVLSKKDSLVIMPTGAGKSLCYQLPALLNNGLTVVISPLIALMHDQVISLLSNNIAAAYLNSSLDAKQIKEVEENVKLGRIKLLYIAPERLALDSFQAMIKDVNIGLIAIDEAHCISEWGHEFRPEYRNLKVLRKSFPNAPVIALTATATRRVRQDIITELEIDNAEIFIDSFNRPNLNYIVRPKANAFDEIVNMLNKHNGESSIIYCYSRKDTEELARKLVNEGINAEPYHAGLDNKKRTNTQQKFMRDEINVITATIAFGMGIDKPDVRLIIHYSLPKSIENYYQETGRAGRDGLPSDCVLFYSYKDKRKQDYFILDISDPEEQKRARNKLGKVIEYCETQECRRHVLLTYFGETYIEENCDGCDICLSDLALVDVTEITTHILFTAYKTGQRFGARYIIDILRGSLIKRIVSNKHCELPYFALAKEYSVEDLGQIINNLIAKGLVIKSDDAYPLLKLTEQGIDFLKTPFKIEARKIEKITKLRKSTNEKVDYDIELFEKLRKIRKKLADAASVPAYVVFGDVSLREMAASKPCTKEEFAKIHGVGAIKFESYSEEFLSIIDENSE